MAARTALEYLRLLQSLLPRGKAWNRAEDSTLTNFLYGQAEEFSRVDGRVVDLLRERDTRYAAELLVDHETDLGLPDDCSDSDATIQERRNTAHSKLITVGQQDPHYFIDIAEALGWTIKITEFSPFICGVHGSGDSCGDSGVIFYWLVTITVGGGDIIYFRSGSSQSGDLLSFARGTDQLVCILNKYKPAHTIMIYDYDGPEFDYAFSSAFDSMPTDSDSYLMGAFDQGFGLGFDVNLGGEFDSPAFGNGFRKPSYNFISEWAFGTGFSSAFDIYN